MDKFVLLVSILLVASGQSEEPGFRIALTSKGLDYIPQVGIPILEKELASLKIPDMSFTTHVDVVGHVTVDVKNIQLSNMKIPVLSIKTAPTTGLTIHSTGLGINGHADWRYHNHGWIHISDSGSLDMSVSDTTLTISAILGKDSTGHPTLKTTSCSVSIGSLHVHLHGGASWLYNLFDSKIDDSIKHAIESKLCPAATDAINKNVNHALETLPVVEKVDTTSEVNYELIADPIFTTTYIETQHKGEFFSIAKPVEAPFSPPTLPPINSTDKMMYLWITDYVANTAGFVYQNSGILTYNVTPDMIPKFKLNTDSFKLFIPKLSELYPNRPMQLDLKSSKPPNLNIVPGSANFTLTGTIDVNVVESNNSIVNAFLLGLVVYADVQVFIQPNGTQEIVTGKCTLIKFDMNLISTNVGGFSVNDLQDFINAIVNAVVIPKLNKYTNKGLVIPMIDGITFVDSKLELGQGYLLIGTDINYKPTF